MGRRSSRVWATRARAYVNAVNAGDMDAALEGMTRFVRRRRRFLRAIGVELRRRMDAVTGSIQRRAPARDWSGRHVR